MAFEVVIPNQLKNPELNQEFVEVIYNNGSYENILLHDYRTIFKIQGLFEQIFLIKLRSNSHNIICEKLMTILKGIKIRNADCKILELGAGNGVTGEVFKEHGFQNIVGIDIIEEARNAAFRDRKSIYSKYFVFDSTDQESKEFTFLRKQKFNVLLIVAAIGMGHIGSRSIRNAFNLIIIGGFIVFNIYSKLINQHQDNEFDSMIATFSAHSKLLLKENYVHRLTVNEAEVIYTIFIFRKVTHIEHESIL